MNLLFLYDSPLNTEKGGTERATGLVMQELERRGHHCMGFLHINQNNPDEIYFNNKPIQSLLDFLSKHKIDVVVNQIAFHYWLLKEFLAHGGQKWKDEGGKIISFMHFDPSGKKKLLLRDLFRDFGRKTLWGKVKRIGLVLYRPILEYKINKIERMSFRYIYEKSDAYVLMSSSYIIPFMKKAGIKDTDKISIITNMLTFPTILDVKSISEKQKIVIVVARLDEKQKRISSILRVWNTINIDDWKLLIIGTGQDEAFYHKMVEKMHIRNVEFLGHRSPELYYKQAKIFLMSSPHEGWGLTITESLQYGVVPIVLDTSTVFHDIIIDRMNGFLVSNEKEMADKLKALMLDSPLLYQMAQNALSSAVRFSPEKIGLKWEQLLSKL